MTQQFAVIGLPIKHSLSPSIHEGFAKKTKLHLTYVKILGDEVIFEKQVCDFFKAGGKGLNVTLPFKQRAYAMAQERTPRCERAGAANTLWMKDGKLWADNTDGIGLIRDLSHYVAIKAAKILVLGAGGAVRGILGPLLDCEPHSLVLANRSLENAEKLRADFPEITCYALTKIPGSFDLVINATSANTIDEKVLIPESIFSGQPFCYDLAYQLNQPTAFVIKARDFACKAVDGLGMLKEQAAESFYLWHGIRIC